jgi:hypothetical protein
MPIRDPVRTPDPVPGFDATVEWSRVYGLRSDRQTEYPIKPRPDSVPNIGCEGSGMREQRKGV